YIVEAKSGLLKNSFDKVAIAPTDGSWERGPMYLVDRQELFVGGTILDTETGQIIHKEERYTTNHLPFVTADRVYLSANLAGVVAFDRPAYNINWIYQPQSKTQWIPLNVLSPIAILDGIGYALFSDATLRAFDLETGQEVGYWQPGIFDLLRWPLCQIPPVPGCIQTARAGLTTSEDTLFVSFGDGKLYAFGQ
ncbi:MAG TPA: hypothetical protein VEC93_02850, partial [Anaerolineae bacterium]|nr:hypothetical protein [Anaerolineae bacterium]